MPEICTHLDSIKFAPPIPEGVAGCEECLKIGAHWVHLRQCRTCGKVGCCDSSVNRHASKHARATGHPLVHSAQPGEPWTYCFVDDVAFIVDGEEG